ncbi:MAG: Nif3-like dinuclear metal center hexameric protein [Bacteroidales bacterium]|nr:Nif3-like dinuclear metal center hexameric protein [Bacteroidales bacterium]
MKIKDITQYLDQQFPPVYQEDYDNSGFLVGDLESECTGVLVTLDVTSAVVAEAIRLGHNLIVSHHPVIFSGLKRITTQSTTGQLVIQLLRHGISVYSAHTNLDNMLCGVNGELATKLGIADCRILHPQQPCTPDIGAGIIGKLCNPMPASEFLAQVKQTLHIPVLRTTTICRDMVSRIAICGGAGSFLIGDAIAANADIYLTGDLKYHDFQRAEGLITMADIGHFESEQFARELICRSISEKFRTFACRIANTSTGFVRYM